MRTDQTRAKVLPGTNRNGAGASASRKVAQRGSAPTSSYSAPAPNAAGGVRATQSNKTVSCSRTYRPRHTHTHTHARTSLWSALRGRMAGGTRSGRYMLLEAELVGTPQGLGIHLHDDTHQPPRHQLRRKLALIRRRRRPGPHGHQCTPRERQRCTERAYTGMRVRETECVYV
jgi:hypothetical protein